MDETVVEQIVRSLSFEVVAIPEDTTEVDHPTKSTPVNVKIRVRKKADAGIPDGAKFTSKVGKDMPGRIRLVSSDQTIMSFNVVMENEFNQNLTLQPGSSYKADIATPSGKQSDGIVKNRFTLSKKDKLNASPILSKRNRDIFGRCKPGGCLDPPFGEDRYTYKPAKNKPSLVESSLLATGKTTATVKSINMPSKKSFPEVSAKNTTSPDKRTTTSKVVNDSNKSRSSSIFKNLSFKKKKSEKRDQDDERFKNDTDSQTKSASVLNLYQSEYLGESTYSNSIITYPPTTNTSDQQIQERRYSKISPSKDEMSSIASFFIVPKKVKNRVDQSSKKPDNVDRITKEREKDVEQNKKDLHNIQHESSLLKPASESNNSEQTNLAPVRLLLLSAMDDMNQDNKNKPIQTKEQVVHNFKEIINVSQEDESKKSAIINKLTHNLNSKDSITEVNADSLITEVKPDSFTDESLGNKPCHEEIQQLHLIQEPEIIFIKNVNEVTETKTNRAGSLEIDRKLEPVTCDAKSIMSKNEDEQNNILLPVTEEKTSFIQKDDLDTDMNKSKVINYNYEIKQDFVDDSKIFIPVDIALSEPNEYNSNDQTNINIAISSQNIKIVDSGNNDLDISPIPTDLKHDREPIQNNQDIQYISENIKTSLRSESNNVISSEDVESHMEIPKFEEQSEVAEVKLPKYMTSNNQVQANDLVNSIQDKVLTSADLNTSVKLNDSDRDIVSDFGNIPTILEDKTYNISTYNTATATHVPVEKEILNVQSPNTTSHSISTDKNLEKPLEFQNEPFPLENLTNGFEFNKEYEEDINKEEIVYSHNNNDTFNDVTLNSSDDKGPLKIINDSEPLDGNQNDKGENKNSLDDNLLIMSDEIKIDEVLEGHLKENLSQINNNLSERELNEPLSENDNLHTISDEMNINEESEVKIRESLSEKDNLHTIPDEIKINNVSERKLNEFFSENDNLHTMADEIKINKESDRKVRESLSEKDNLHTISDEIKLNEESEGKIREFLSEKDKLQTMLHEIQVNEGLEEQLRTFLPDKNISHIISDDINIYIDNVPERQLSEYLTENDNLHTTSDQINMNSISDDTKINNVSDKHLNEPIPEYVSLHNISDEIKINDESEGQNRESLSENDKLQIMSSQIKINKESEGKIGESLSEQDNLHTMADDMKINEESEGQLRESLSGKVNLLTVEDEIKINKELIGQIRESLSENYNLHTMSDAIKINTESESQLRESLSKKDKLLIESDEIRINQVLEENLREMLSYEPFPQKLELIAVKQPQRIDSTDISEKDRSANSKDDSKPVLSDGHTFNSISRTNAESWKVDLALHAYVNEQNERVIKSFDSNNVPDEYQNDTLVIAKRSLDKKSRAIKIPLDNENELTILMRNNISDKFLSNLNENIAQESETNAKQKTIRIKARGNVVENTDNNINKSEARHHVINDDHNLRDALISIYEQELVPLQDVIKGLREEIDKLSAYRLMIFEKSNKKRWKPQRISHSNRRCGCFRKI